MSRAKRTWGSRSLSDEYKTNSYLVGLSPKHFTIWKSWSMSESPGRKTSAMAFSVDACSENGHLGKVGLLRAFLHRDTQWPTGQPNIVKVNWVTFLWHMLDIIVMGACELQSGVDSTNYVTS